MAGMYPRLVADSADEMQRSVRFGELLLILKATRK
jgi:hypothetical protein